MLVFTFYINLCSLTSVVSTPEDLSHWGRRYESRTRWGRGWSRGLTWPVRTTWATTSCWPASALKHHRKMITCRLEVRGYVSIEWSSCQQASVGLYSAWAPHSHAPDGPGKCRRILSWCSSCWHPPRLVTAHWRYLGKQGAVLYTTVRQRLSSQLYVQSCILNVGGYIYIYINCCIYK